ncbi:MAG: hypothetical protein IJ555_01725 [Ruminococcus sp.]|nr:hypothetical protein [Ruminococcus sp.]MBR1752267.1 hypothetical protein [Ruminococcus sp.]
MKKWITSPDMYRGAARYRIKRAISNFENNKREFTPLKDSMLHGQGTAVLKRLTYGTHSLEWCGCELIACANALKMSGHYMPLPQVIYEFELNRMHYIFPSGYFGTAPRKMTRFFDYHDIPYDKFDKASELEEHLSGMDSACGILSFWNRTRESCKLFPLQFFTKGLHTVAFEKHHSKIYVYNRRNGAESASVYGDISEVYADRRFITGFVFERK